MIRRTIFFLVVFCLTNASAREKYFYDSKEMQGKSLDQYFLKMEEHIATELRQFVLKKLNGKTEIFAASHGFGFFNGEKIKLKDLKYEGKDYKKNEFSIGQGFQVPRFPQKENEILNKMPIDQFDYYARIFLETTNGRKSIDLPLDYGVNFICGSQKCRDTDITEFFNHEMDYSNSNNMRPKNNDKTMLGIYYKWKDQITSIQFTKTSDFNRVNLEDFLKNYKENPKIYFAMKNRLLVRGMTPEEAGLSIGNGAQMGFSNYQFDSNNKLIDFTFQKNERRLEL